jgi:hypothetical protein
MAAGWSIFSGMSWLWAFERLGAGLESVVGFFYGSVDAWRDRQIGREVAQQREVVVEEEKRRVELHDPIVIETPPPEVPVSKKAEEADRAREAGGAVPRGHHRRSVAAAAPARPGAAGHRNGRAPKRSNTPRA